ncbi:MAG: DUF3307 domain-containing protein [Bacillota bacterium]
MEKYIAVLFAAHFIADFLLQPDSLVSKKNNPFYLIIHAAIHALVSYLLLQNWTEWLVPLLVFISHLFIDYIKQIKTGGTDSTKVMVIDQALHLAGLLLIVLFANFTLPIIVFTGIGYKAIITLAAFSVIVLGSGHFIGRYMKEIFKENDMPTEGLKNGGKLIGQLERMLVLILILIGQPLGIGFLVAAKSILRFEESKVQLIAEYVIIGTLLSFTLAIAFSSLAVWAINF